MKTRPYILHALSPLHVGTGQSADIIDLPIARMRASGIPLVPGSSIKGVLRSACRDSELDKDRLEAVFGPETIDADQHAGAIICGDARLLALPVRSFRGTFAWVSSPLLLSLANRDRGDLLPVPELRGRKALVMDGSINEHRGKVYLEDLDLPSGKDDALEDWASWIDGAVFAGENGFFRKRFVVVDDETMTFLWETATQVDARVRIDGETGTVAKGALWFEESLPPETLLIGTMAGDRSRRRGTRLSEDEVLDLAIGKLRHLQVGGKATVGRGRCRILQAETSRREAK